MTHATEIGSTSGPPGFESEFPGDVLWLQNAGRSRTPKRAVEAVRGVAERLHRERDYVSGYLAARDQLRQQIGRLIGASPADITLTRSTAHGLSLVAAGLDWRPGDNVVSARWEYPANVYPWLALEKRGVEIRQVELVEGRVEPEAVEAAIDERTRVVALSLVQFWNGCRLAAAEVGRICRRHGIIFVLDAIQALGALRLDVGATGADVVAAGALKWMLGPAGIGFCYLRPEVAQMLDPPLIGVGSFENHGSPFEPSRELRPTALRFEESVASWYDIAGFAAGLSLIEQVGYDVIERRVLNLADRIAAVLAERGFDLAPPWPRRQDECSGIVAARSQTSSAAGIVERLAAEGAIVRAHGEYVRFSPHFYVDDDQFDRFLSTLMQMKT